MKEVMTITYSWWKSENRSEPCDEHREALRESAQERITEQIQEGFASGQLLEDIRLTDADGEGVAYNGWWDMTTKEVDKD